MSPPNTPTSTSTSVPASPAIRVVLVEDLDDVRRLVRTALRFRGGFEVVGEATTGAEAIELAGSALPDVVVLDLGLPDLAGRDVLAGIRDAAPSAKVVVHSAAEPGDRAWFEERTAGYVLKDADLDYLVDLLESVARPAAANRVLEIRRDLAAGAEARALVRSALVDWGLEPIADDALLVVTELVTNAVTHGGSACVLAVSRSGGGLRIEVTDEGGGTPEPQPHDNTSEGGRGVVLVDALSSSWGVDPLPTGKKVWAEIAAP